MAKKDKVTSDELEVCAGCDATAPQHPWVGVMHTDDAKDAEASIVVRTADNPDFVGVAVCDACHRDPAHRKFPLKCHFHPRATGRVGVIMAGSADVGM